MKTLLLILTWIFISINAAHSSPIITELVAKNTRFADALSENHDWIEIYNPDNTPFNLRDHHLTDDAENLTKWRLTQDLIIQPKGFLIIFASGKDGFFEGQAHTNFKLSRTQGESLLLVAPDGGTIVHSLPNGFPSLEDNQSFGLVANSQPANFTYLKTSTPGAANSEAIRIAQLSDFQASSIETNLGESVTLTWSGAQADHRAIYSTHLFPLTKPFF